MRSGRKSGSDRRGSSGVLPIPLSEKLFHSVKSYIDDTYIQEKSLEEYGVSNKRDVRDIELLQLREAMSRRRRAELEYNSMICDAISEADQDYEIGEVPLAPSAPRKLEDLMKEIDETFSEGLIRLIDQKGL